MTTLVAIQGESWAVIAYDSRVTEDKQKIFSLPKDSGKVVKNGSYLLGAAGDLRAVNLLAHVFKPPTVGASLYGAKLDKFISSSFVPELKKCFEEASYSKDGEMDSQIMVLVNGVIYEIGVDYSWARDESGIYAIGSGGDFAIGALHATLETRKRTLATAKALARQALMIASKMDVGTAPPIYIQVQHFG